MTKREILKQEIKEDNTLVILEEIGKIDIDFIDEDLGEFIEALEEVTGKEYYISNEVGGQFIREYR